MNKLIVLLNEFIDDGQERVYACYSLDDGFDKFFHTKDGEGIIEEAQVISKKFGFIKRLIKNLEIDLSKINMNRLNHVDDDILENQILKTLAVQDEPIDFLSSILK